MPVITPVQKISLDPTAGKLFEFNTADSRLYLSRTINDLLRVYGNNVVIDGMKPSPTPVLNITANSVTFTTTVSPGLAIVDTTLCEDLSSPNVPTQLTLNIDPLWNRANAKILVFINFQYIDAFVDNRFGYNLILTDPNGVVSVAQTPIDFNKDNVLLGVYDFDATGNNISLRPVHSYSPYFINGAVSQFTVTDPNSNNTRTYTIYPPSTISKMIAKAIQAAL